MLKFIPPEITMPIRMSELVSNSTGRILKTNISYPPKQPRDILELIKSGNTNGISLIEWNRFITYTSIWSELEGTSDIDDIIIGVLSEAEINKNFRQLLLFKAVLSIENKNQLLPDPLFLNLQLLADGLTGVDSKRFNLLALLEKNAQEDIAKLLFEHSLTPKELLTQYGWPTYTQVLGLLETALLLFIGEYLWLSNSSFLLKCLTELDTNKVVVLVELVVSKLEKEPPQGELKAWLIKNVSPRSESTLWDRMSAQAKAILVKILKLNLFIQHQRIISRIIIEYGFLLDPDVAKRVQNRIDFWSNYSDRMLRSRLLITPKLFSIPVFSNSENIGCSEIEPIDLAYPSEVLILEFNGVCIVDHLRPTWGAVRFYKSEYSTSKALFDNNLKLEHDLLNLHQDDIHDHAFLWQWSLEKLLREKYKLKPNPRITRFRSLGARFNSYVHGSGLSRPDKTSREQREATLVDWELNFIKREKGFGKYRNIASLEHNILDNKLRNLTSSGNYAEYVDVLKLKANAGFLWAMKDLSKYLLTKQPASQHDRETGTYWHERAMASESSGAG